MRIGYARVSTDDQTLDLQRDALKRAKCRQIYEEHASGKTAMRPELEACLKSLRKGDTLVVWRLDRLGRSLGDLIQLTTELRSRGVDFESLTEKIETGSSTGIENVRTNTYFSDKRVYRDLADRRPHFPGKGAN
jgi:DNA invertase Pin-like site-specific DNA recombinase